MALVNSSFTVNVTPGAMPPVVHVSEYDVGRTYTVTINGENGSAFNIPTGTTATVEGTLNGEIGFTTTATIANNAVSFALTESMTAKSGKAWCKIKLTLNNEPIQTCAFVLAVDRAGVESDTVVGAPGFDEQIQDAVYDYLDENGQDAVSPQVTITSITGGHRVTITDSEHPNGQYFDVMDGEDDSGGAVESVNGQTGVVVLDASDVGALPDDTQIPSKTSDLTNDSGFVTAQQAAASAPVQSVNGQTGAVVLGAADVHALPDSTVIPPTVTEQAVAGWGFTKNTGTYSKPSGGIPASDLASDVQTSLGKADTALQTAPVTSVNGKTGQVTVNEVPDYSHAIDGQVLTKAQDGPRWANNNPSSGAALRLLYDGAFGPDDPELMLMGNVADAETGNAIATALYYGRIGSAVLVDVTDPNTEVVYDLFAVDYDAQTHVSTVVFARTEGALIRTATLSGSTKTAPVFGTIPIAGGSADAVLYTAQSLTDAQKAQARNNIGSGTYSKPSGGIPKSDLASGVIPVVPQMATDSNMSDWTSGKTVDAAVLKQGVQYIERMIEEKPGYSDIPTDNAQLGNGAGYQTAQQVQTAVAAIPAVRYDAAQSISSAQKQQARENIGAGTYSKPSGGIPASDLADGVIPIVPSASAAAPLMDGTAAAGSSAAYARGDHVHPSDTTKLGVSDNAYRAASIPMGHVDSTSTATAFTATVPGITELRDGVCMWLRNGVITSASGFTLNVNGLGAKPCYSSLAAASRSTTIFNVNYTMLFVYNSTRVEGGCWDIVYGVDTNTTYTPPKLGFGYAVCTTAAATAAKTASISSYALTAGGIVSIKFDHDVPAGATLNISSKGVRAIYHRGAAITAGVIKAGDTATFVYSTYYHLIAIDRDEVGGSTITVDDAMSSSSENPVQNKVVQAALDAKADASSIPTVPVQSVNGKTGAVSLNAEDVGAFSETDGAVLESRIDAAISSVTTDSEVQDIRVASDGTVYAAAGTAVRTQFDALNALTVKTESRNLWNPNDPDFGAGVRLYADGNTTEGNYNTSGYMRATPGDILYATYMSGTAVSGVWVAYNALKAIITGSGVSADNYTVPTGAFYVRFCVYKNYDKLLQVEVGSKTPYKPYQETELYLDRTKLSTANAKTNALTDVILGYVCYRGKLNNTTGGFATAPIEIPDGATTLYMRTTTAAGFTVAQYFDTNMSYIDGSVGNIVLNNTHALTLNQSAKYIQLSGTGWSDDYAGTILLTFSFDTFTLLDNGVKSVSEPGIGYDAISIFGKREYPSAFINSVAHRGYTQVAPENTLPAFIAARKYGYDRAELDVQWTSNRVPVVLHDGSINETGRNADGTAISGTIDIEDITYQQALSYDFGIWFDQKFAGTKIPTLEEVLTLAKRIGLHLNIELKAESHPTQSDVENVVALVKAHSMEEYVSFHSTATTLLGYVHAAMPDATLAIIVQQITQTQIDSALALKGNNKVYLSSSVYGSSEVALCKSNGIGLSVWTLNTESAITALDPYVSSVTSDKLHAGFVLYKSAMGE